VSGGFSTGFLVCEMRELGIGSVQILWESRERSDLRRKSKPLRGRILLYVTPTMKWVFGIVGIIAVGILSRVVHTGLAIFDKYLGDALYAAMVYGILRLFARAGVSAVCAMAIMTAIEFFQLTMIPAHMLANEHLIVRICGRLLGTEFSFLDLLAYGVGIACIYVVDSLQGRRPDELRGRP